MPNQNPEQVINNSPKVEATIKLFNDFFEIYDGVLPYLSIDETKRNSIEKRKELIDKLGQTEFHVAFLGSFSAGKSTIINGILGREILPESNESTTAFPTIIKKGERNEAFIHFIDEEARRNLWNYFVAEIGKKIGKDVKMEVNELLGKHLQRIEGEIKKYQEETGNAIEQQPVQKLKLLLGDLGKGVYTGIKAIPIKDLKEYVEGHPGAIFVARMEVFLEKLNIPEDIVLVDLPGLGVDNKRHEEFTKEYIKEKAKAFVVCNNPFKILQGDEITFLSQINQQSSTIIQRSFWVINQWDLPDEKQKEQAISTFEKRIKEYDFTINDERLFKTSALNYFLLASIAKGTLNETEQLKTHLDNLQKLRIDDPKNITAEQAQEILTTHPDLRAFSRFLEALFNYLNQEAKEEFIEDAKKELRQIITILERILNPFYEQYSQRADLEKEIEDRETDEQSDFFIKQLKEKIREFAQLRISEERNFWQQSDTNDVLQELGRKIMKVNRDELKNCVMQGMDVFIDISVLPGFLNREIELSLLMRKKLISVIDSFFIQRLNKLFTDLETPKNGYSLPEKIRKHLQDKLSERDISMRLNGLADGLFYEYGKELQSLGSRLKECQNENVSEYLNKILEMYKTELDKFVEKLVPELNKNLKLSLKNHIEYLEKELLRLIDDEESRHSIRGQIRRNLKLADLVKKEIEKQTIFTKSYEELLKLRSAVNQ